jgi:hypothetical protein
VSPPPGSLPWSFPQVLSSPLCLLPPYLIWGIIFVDARLSLRFSLLKGNIGMNHLYTQGSAKC